MRRTGDKDKSMVHVLYILRLVKGTPWDKVTLSNEEIKPIALSTVELRLAEGISLLVKFSSERSFITTYWKGLGLI